MAQERPQAQPPPNETPAQREAREREEKEREAREGDEDAPSAQLQASREFEELRNATLPLDDPVDPRSNVEDYGHVQPLPHQVSWPQDEPRAEDIARMSIMPETHPSIKIKNVGPSGTGGSSTHESRGGTYPFHPGGAYLPTAEAQAEAEDQALEAAGRRKLWETDPARAREETKRAREAQGARAGRMEGMERSPKTPVGARGAEPKK